MLKGWRHGFMTEREKVMNIANKESSQREAD